MIRLAFLLVLCLLSEGMMAQSQTKFFSEGKLDSIWIYKVRVANLSFTAPSNFAVIPMKDCNYGIWNCRGFFEQGFDRVLINSDSTVILGLQVLSNDTWTDSKGKIFSTGVNWKKNAEKVYSNRVDTSQNISFLSTNYLRDSLSADYGIIFTRKPCKESFMKGFDLNRHVVIASADFQILAVFFYKNSSQNIDSIIHNTKGMFRSKRQ